MPYVDEMVGLDHSSTDLSAAVFTEIVGEPPFEPQTPIREWARGGEFDVRSALLQEGRRRGGTHFLVLDADEALTPQAGEYLRGNLAAMKPGSRMLMQWIICWKSTRRYRIGRSIWNLPYKDFAFRDSPLADYSLGTGIHLPRTPATPGANDLRVPSAHGGVLHFQFAFWESTQVKQAWYQCIEYLQGEKSARQVNRMYMISKEDAHAKVAPLPQEWLPKFMPSAPGKDWRSAEVYQWFDEYGIEYFEPLDIWGVAEFKAEFIRRVGRHPRPDTRSEWMARARRRFMQGK